METVELFGRNIVNCVEELIGNPAFKDHMSYVAGEKNTAGYAEGGNDAGQDEVERVFDEMCTAEFWRRLEVCLSLSPVALADEPTIRAS